MSWPLAWATAALLLPSWFEMEQDHAITMEQYYERIRNTVSFAPPGWIYGPVWLSLYIAISVAVGFWADKPLAKLDEPLFHWTLVVLTLNFIFNKAWQIIFFDLRNTVLAAVDAVLILATAVVALILFTLNGGSAAIVYILWSLYIAWVAFATILSITIAARRSQLSRGTLGTTDFDVNEVGQ